MTVRRRWKIISVLSVMLLIVGGLCSCRSGNEVASRLSQQMPQRILWAWDRPEDLRFLDTSRYGVAFLAQTLAVKQDSVTAAKRAQPLEIPPGVYLIAVTRIETQRDQRNMPAYSESQIEKIVDLVARTATLGDVKAVQIDFDAVASEREFYRRMMKKLRQTLPEQMPLTMTSLASWCVGDAWFNDFPVDEAVPMAFEMGRDDAVIRKFLADGKDWREPLCRGSYGVSVDEPITSPLNTARRIYFFKRSPWKAEDIPSLESQHK